jgi:hypothetical protein
MEIVLAIVVLGSLLLNVGLALQLIKVLRIEPQPIIITMPVEINPKSSEEVKVETPPVPESVTKKEQTALQAWTNRKNIPWDEVNRPKPEPVRLQRPGPLERPQGFV